jgi:hypothetical protein
VGERLDQEAGVAEAVPEATLEGGTGGGAAGAAQRIRLNSRS